MRLRTQRSLHQLYSGATTTGLDIVDEASSNYLVTIRPRVGFASGSALIYVTGGLAITTLKQSHSVKEFGFGAAGTCSPTSSNYCNDPANSSDVKYGWTIGGGIEWAVNRAWSLKAEYLFADFGSESTTSNLVHGAPAQTFDHNADLTVQTVRFGINYKLN
jgi:outer membrane immunogenic protein